MDDVRAVVHGMWASVAEGWAQHAEYVDRRGPEVMEALLHGGGVAPGGSVLELACGPASAGIAAAQRVGSAGRVVVSDVVPAMVELAATRARAAGLGNTEALVLDLEAIAQPDSTFDTVLCREGLMFAVEPERAAAEIRRVLRPGGTAAIATWGDPTRNPWLQLVLGAVGDAVGHPVPPPGVPGPFSLADPDRLRAVLRAGGFAEVDVDEHPCPVEASGFEEWWGRMPAMAGPLAKVLAGLPAEARAGIEQRLRSEVAVYATPNGLELPGVALVAIAR